MAEACASAEVTYTTHVSSLPSNTDAGHDAEPDRGQPVPQPAGPPPTRWYTPWRTVRTVRGMLTDAIDFVGARFEAYGDTYRVDEGGGRFLYVTRDPEAIRDLLVSNARDFRKRGGANDRLLPILGDGLLTAEGDAWQEARRLLQPTFHRTAVQAYAEAMAGHARALSWTDGQRLDLSNAMARLTLDIVCDTLFDHVNRDGDVDAIARTMLTLQENTNRLLPDWVPSRSRQRGRVALVELHDHIDRLCARRELEGLRTDMVSMLLRVGLDRRQIRDQLVTFFLAGHETTSHALTWTWWLLATHPQVEARLHAELDASLAPNEAPGPDHDLPLLDAILQESLRLYPPAYVLPRVARRDTTLHGLPIAAGSQVVAWLWHVHRDARSFPDPDAFRPDRFLTDDIPRHAYLPFGSGQRMCIGIAFARMELRILLAMLARRYRLVAPPGQQVRPKPRVTLIPQVEGAAGVPMRVAVR